MWIAAAHAKELSKKIKGIRSQTGQHQVNIVGHSKGGVDARVYLAVVPTHLGNKLTYRLRLHFCEEVYIL